MGRDPGAILKEALKLPQASRAALGASLLNSLDETIDENVEAAAERLRRKR